MRWTLLLAAASLLACDDPAPPPTATTVPRPAPPATPETAESPAPTPPETEAAPAQKTCYQAKTAWCVVYQVDAMTDDDQESCELLGGSISDAPCPSENVLGRCDFGLKDGLAETERVFYAIDRDPMMLDDGDPPAYTAAMAQRECEEDGGGEWHGAS